MRRRHFETVELSLAARNGKFLREHRIRVASAEGLILLKMMTFRTRDQLDIENLVAANRGHLDIAWIQAEWETLAGLDDPRMQRFMELVG